MMGYLVLLVFSAAVVGAWYLFNTFSGPPRHKNNSIEVELTKSFLYEAMFGLSNEVNGLSEKEKFSFRKFISQMKQTLPNENDPAVPLLRKLAVVRNCINHLEGCPSLSNQFATKRKEELTTFINSSWRIVKSNPTDWFKTEKYNTLVQKLQKIMRTTRWQPMVKKPPSQ